MARRGRMDPCRPDPSALARHGRPRTVASGCESRRSRHRDGARAVDRPLHRTDGHAAARRDRGARAAWIERQRGRHAKASDTPSRWWMPRPRRRRPLRLWLAELGEGRATAGYVVAPSAPRPRSSGRRAHRPDRLRGDRAGPAPHRTVHRAVERPVDPHRRTRGLRTRGDCCAATTASAASGRDMLLYATVVHSPGP